MLSIEIRVNGNPVGQVTAYRGEDVPDSSEPTFTYPYRASFFPLNHRQSPVSYHGSVGHYFNDGIEKLAAKILADIAENSPPAR